MEGYDEDSHFEAVKAFYQMPESEKRKLLFHHHNTENNNYFRGMVPFQPNDPAHKEMYDMGGSYHLVSKKEKQYPLLEDSPFPS